MTDLKERIDSYFQVDAVLEQVVTKYCLDHFGRDWVVAFNTEINQTGQRMIIVHWREDSYTSRPDICGEDEILLEDLMPYLEHQCELEEFDRKLEEDIS